MIRRTMTAAFLNEVANEPDIRPWLGGEGPIDLGPTLANPANIGIEAPHGGWLFHPILPGVYEVHSMFRKDGRGKSFMEAAREVLRYLFTETDALEIATKCPDDNGPARMAAAAVGFRERFRRENAWAPGVGISYQVFSVDDWFVRDPLCLEAGRVFHTLLEEAKILGGSALPVHEDDETHDRAVGAAALMIRAGNVAKGVAFYNRWAALAGYASIEAVGPSLIDVRDAIVEVDRGSTVPGSMRVVLLRGVDVP